MFVASKIILKSALLAAGAAAPFIAATPTGNGSTQPPVSAIVGTAQIAPDKNLSQTLSAPGSQSVPNTQILPDSSRLPSTITVMGQPDKYVLISPGMKTQHLSATPRTVTPEMKEELKSLEDYARHHSDTPNMTSMPQSYEIYLLHRSDGVLIGPNGVVPLAHSVPKNILIEPEKKP